MRNIDPFQIRALFHVVAMRAGIAALEAQRSTRVVKDTGGGGGITTQADLDAQQIITEMLFDSFPIIPIIAEEGNIRTICPEIAFYVDPVDGSAPYKAGSPIGQRRLRTDPLSFLKV